MATRLYMTSVAPSWAPSLFRGAWNDTAGARTVKWGREKEGPSTSVSRTETSATNNWKACLVRAVSDPLPSGGTFDAALTYIWVRQESNAAANMFLYYYIWVTSGDTNTMRGEVSSLLGATEFSTTLNGQTFTDNDTPVQVQPGDRVVLEVGYSAANTSTTSYTGTTRVGGTQDLDPAATVTTHSPWVEFANNDAIFNPPPAGPTYSVLMPDGTQAPATLSGVLMPDGTLMPITTAVQL